ncbi:MAG: hypothetical protein KYX66_12405 [Blastomonas fulva]|uniref:hypothetical protein n=1 Tax=Blastomonas fulva TaxID=1550728 RepID=UPI0024E1DC1B|nr:hypothetical protein [Blastomonas fulva]MDK2757527.1 hypothetical protein [Blastomonas fulva]
MTTPPPIPAPPPIAPMSPGTYLRKRREAAGISIELAALAFVPWPDPTLPAGQRLLIADLGHSLAIDYGIKARGQSQLLELVRAWARKIEKIEADAQIVDSAITTVLARLIPLDIQIFDALVALWLGVAVPIPQICRDCGCSWHRPCVDRVESGIPGCFAEYGCSWSASDPNLCTACERKAAAPQQETADAS